MKSKDLPAIPSMLDSTGPEDVETNRSVGVDVGVVDLGHQADLGRLEGVVGRDGSAAFTMDVQGVWQRLIWAWGVSTAGVGDVRDGCPGRVTALDPGVGSVNGGVRDGCPGLGVGVGSINSGIEPRM